jgi:hypothetical protein
VDLYFYLFLQFTGRFFEKLAKIFPTAAAGIPSPWKTVPERLSCPRGIPGGAA